MLRPTIAAALALSIVALGAAPAQTLPEPSRYGSRPEVLVLGTWHMANIVEGPDDILETARQEELLEVLEALTRFKPTKIALEAAFYRSDDMNRLYGKYVHGEHTLNRNERQQVGFRLAKQLGHETIYSIDADGDFPMLTLQDYIEANGLSDMFAKVQRAFNAHLDEEDKYLTSHTLLEALVRMNSDDAVSANMQHDYELARFGKPWNWAGPDLLGDWFQRNIRIYGNIVSITESDDRVLVIIGAGHLAWLRHNFTADPEIRLRTLEEFVQ